MSSLSVLEPEKTQECNMNPLVELNKDLTDFQDYFHVFVKPCTSLLPHLQTFWLWRVWLKMLYISIISPWLPYNSSLIIIIVERTASWLGEITFRYTVCAQTALSIAFNHNVKLIKSITYCFFTQIKVTCLDFISVLWLVMTDISGSPPTLYYNRAPVLQTCQTYRSELI